MKPFKKEILNKYAGYCMVCGEIVSRSQGVARLYAADAQHGHDYWKPLHFKCAGIGVTKVRPKISAVTAPKRKATLQNRLDFGVEYENTRKYSEDASISEPLNIATDPTDIQYHLSCVMLLAKEFRVND